MHSYCLQISLIIVSFQMREPAWNLLWIPCELLNMTVSWKKSQNHRYHIFLHCFQIAGLKGQRWPSWKRANPCKSWNARFPFRVRIRCDLCFTAGRTIKGEIDFGICGALILQQALDFILNECLSVWWGECLSVFVSLWCNYPGIHVGKSMRKEQREAGGCLFKAKWPASGVELWGDAPFLFLGWKWFLTEEEWGSWLPLGCGREFGMGEHQM